jgi:hypothetical protein
VIKYTRLLYKIRTLYFFEWFQRFQIKYYYLVQIFFYSPRLTVLICAHTEASCLNIDFAKITTKKISILLWHKYIMRNRHLSLIDRQRETIPAVTIYFSQLYDRPTHAVQGWTVAQAYIHTRITDPLATKQVWHAFNAEGERGVSLKLLEMSKITTR